MEAVGKSIRGPQRMLVSHGSLSPAFKKLHYKKLRPDFAEQNTSLQETIQTDSCSVSYKMVHSNIIRPIFEYVSNRSQFSHIDH